MPQQWPKPLQWQCWIFNPLYHKWTLTYIYMYIFCCCFCLFRAVLMAYGGSQARDWIRAVAAGLHHRHSNAGTKLHHSSWQHQILNPLSKARDGTCVLMDASQIRFLWARMGIPLYFSYIVSFHVLYQEIGYSSLCYTAKSHCYPFKM